MGNQKADREAKRVAATQQNIDDIYTAEIMPTHIDHLRLRKTCGETKEPHRHKEKFGRA